MALTKQDVVDSVEVVGDNINVRVSRTISEDGVVITRGIHRHVVNRSDDLTDEDPKVKTVAYAVWPETAPQ